MRTCCAPRAGSAADDERPGRPAAVPMRVERDDLHAHTRPARERPHRSPGPGRSGSCRAGWACSALCRRCRSRSRTRSGGSRARRSSPRQGSATRPLASTMRHWTSAGVTGSSCQGAGALNAGMSIALATMSNLPLGRPTCLRRGPAALEVNIRHGRARVIRVRPHRSRTERVDVHAAAVLGEMHVAPALDDVADDRPVRDDTLARLHRRHDVPVLEHGAVVAPDGDDASPVNRATPPVRRVHRVPSGAETSTPKWNAFTIPSAAPPIRGSPKGPRTGCCDGRA